MRRQSDHLEAYRTALGFLQDRQMVYPCFCSRQDIARGSDRHHAAKIGPDGPLYPGTCRNLPAAEIDTRLHAGHQPSWRLNVARAIAALPELHWHDREAGWIIARPERFGDVLLARRDVPTSYHLSVVVDDHLQKITLVTRGLDLFDSTDIHRLLQALLGYETPDYLHHRLILDGNGKKLSKRDGALGLRALRESGGMPEEVRALIAAELEK